MDHPEKFIVFYHTDQINVKDIDREIYTKNKKIFHLFFFHNFELDIDKSDLLKIALLKEFDPVQPEMHMDFISNTLTMVKRLSCIDFKKLDEIAEKENVKHEYNIDYRIKCILDTFKLFNRLYQDKTIVYIIPDQLSDKITNMLKSYNLNYKSIEDKNHIIQYYDIVYWANYFSRVNQDSLKNESFKEENLVNIIKIIDNN